MVTKVTVNSGSCQYLVYKTWFSRYPRCRYIIYDNGSEFKLHFRALCDSYGIKRKPTSVKNPQANAILERIHAVLMNMLCTSEIEMADSVKTSDIDVFLTNAAWAIRSTYHTVLKALQEQQYLDETCYLTFRSLLTGRKLENTGNC